MALFKPFATSPILALDFQSLSLFRIVFAAILLVDYQINIHPYYSDLFSETGVLPLAAVLSDDKLQVEAAISRVLEAIKLYHIVPIIYPAALIALLIGYRTRWATAIVLVANIYLFWRNIYTTSGGEELARLLLIWCLFLPMNRYWSIDAALDPQPRHRPYPVLPFLALRLQIICLYFFAALFKIAGPRWLDGSAIAMALSDNVYGGTPAGLFFISYFPEFLKILTYATIVFQFALPVLIYSPWHNNITRALGIGGAVLMHASFVAFLNIGILPFVSLAMMILLAPDSWWNALLRRRRERLARVQIFYEPGCEFCRRISLLLREFLLAGSAQVLPADVDPRMHRLLIEQESWVVRGVDGAIYLKADALAYLLRQNSFLSPLGWLMTLQRLRAPMARLYDCIGANRRWLGSITRRLLPVRAEAPIGLVPQAICGLLAILAVFANVWTVRAPAFGRDEVASGRSRADALEALQIGQQWSLFAPQPVSQQRDLRVRGQQADGSFIDLMTIMPRPLIRRDDNRRQLTFASPRWQKYFGHLYHLTPEQWSALSANLCRQARNSTTGQIVRAIEITSYVQASGGPQVTAGEPVATHREECRLDSNSGPRVP